MILSTIFIDSWFFIPRTTTRTRNARTQIRGVILLVLCPEALRCIVVHLARLMRLAWNIDIWIIHLLMGYYLWIHLMDFWILPIIPFINGINGILSLTWWDSSNITYSMGWSNIIYPLVMTFTVCHGKIHPGLSSVNHLFRLGPSIPWLC